MQTSSHPTAWRWLGAFLSSLALAACGDSGPPATSGPDTPSLSDAAKLAQLEASGAIPKLERLPLIEGIDLDMNGVRDDIDTHIKKTYADEAQRRAAVQMARAYQAMLLVNKDDERALDEVSRQSSRAVACLDHTYPNSADSPAFYQAIEVLRSLTTNTKARLEAYLAYNKARSGSVSRRIGSKTCD